MARPGCWVHVDCEAVSPPASALLSRLFPAEKTLERLLTSLRGRRILAECLGLSRVVESWIVVTVLFLAPLTGSLLWFGLAFDQNDPRVLFALLSLLGWPLAYLIIYWRTPAPATRRAEVQARLSLVHVPDGVELVHVLSAGKDNAALTRFRVEVSPRVLLLMEEQPMVWYPLTDYIRGGRDSFPVVLDGLVSKELFGEIVESLRCLPESKYWWTLWRRRVLVAALILLPFCLAMGTAVLVRPWFKDSLLGALVVACVIYVVVFGGAAVLLCMMARRRVFPHMRAYWSEVDSQLAEVNQQLHAENQNLRVQRDGWNGDQWEQSFLKDLMLAKEILAKTSDEVEIILVSNLVFEPIPV